MTHDAYSGAERVRPIRLNHTYLRCRVTRFMAVAAIVIFVGCMSSVTPSSEVTPQDLWRVPESRLVFPGSTFLDNREGEPHQTIEGWESAFVRSLVGSERPSDEIESFYATELAARGWQLPTDNQAMALSIRTSSELSARSWRKGDLVFRLGILNMSDPYADGPSEGFATLYRISLVDRPPKPVKS